MCRVLVCRSWSLDERSESVKFFPERSNSNRFSPKDNRLRLAARPYPDWSHNWVVYDRINRRVVSGHESRSTARAAANRLNLCLV